MLRQVESKFTGFWLCVCLCLRPDMNKKKKFTLPLPQRSISIEINNNYDYSSPDKGCVVVLRIFASLVIRMGKQTIRSHSRVWMLPLRVHSDAW